MTRAQRSTLIVAILASFVAFLDGNVVNVALPAIVRELGGGLTLQQWVVDAYLLTLGSLILLAGSLSDLLGRKTVLWIGLIGFGVTSIAAALAPDGAALIAARACQGASGALLVPSSLALITATFTDAGERSAAIGRWTAWTTVAFIAGPLLGGLSVQFVSWRLVFGINVIPIGVTVILLARLAAPQERRRARVDVAGAATGALALAAAVFALIEEDGRGWGDPLIVAAVVVAVASAVAFAIIERRVREPMLPFSMFRAGDFAAGNLATAFIYAGGALGPLALGLYLQQVAGVSATLAALAVIPATAVMIALSSRFGALAGRLGSRWFMTAGPLLAAAGFLALLAVAPRYDYWWQVLPGVLLWGAGMSITVAPLTSAVLGAVGPDRAGLASAVNNAVARIAGLVSVALMGVIAGSPLALPGLRRVVIVTAALFVIGGVVSAIGIRDRWRGVPQPSADADAAGRGALD